MADHHHFAKCLKPPALHAILSQLTGEQLHRHCQHFKITPPPFLKEAVRMIPLTVHAPEDPSCSREFNVAVACVRQEQTEAQVKARKGSPADDLRELSSCIWFTGSAIPQQADVVILLGTWDLLPEPCPPQVAPPLFSWNA